MHCRRCAHWPRLVPGSGPVFGARISTVDNRPVSIIEIATGLAVTWFAERFPAEISDRHQSFSLTKMTEEDFSLKKLRPNQYFGYKFGYRRQFALIAASYAKLRVAMGLAGSLNTLDYAYLS
jgi:hypothetical protein